MFNVTSYYITKGSNFVRKETLLDKSEISSLNVQSCSTISSTLFISNWIRCLHLLCFLSAGVSVHPCDFRFGLCLHDHCVFLGSSVWVPGRQQHYSHRHPSIPTGLQVEETPCGQEDAWWVRHFCFFIVSLSICSDKAGEAFITVCYEIPVRISAQVKLWALIHSVCLCSQWKRVKPRCRSNV